MTNIHSKRYGVDHPGGIFFNDNPHQVKLLDFRFRQNEKLLYEYDFGDHWQHAIRIEAILPLDEKQFYPVCTGVTTAYDILRHCGVELGKLDYLGKP